MEEETTRRRRLRDAGECGYAPTEEVVPLKKLRTPPTVVDQDQDQEDMMAWLTLDDDTVTELFELLDSSGPAASTPPQPVKFIDDPYSSLVVFQASSAYVTINGNEESCGSSFSDLDSSVMASVDMGSVRGLVRKLSGNLLNVDAGDAEEEGLCLRGWLEEKDFVEGIFVKSLSGCDLFGTPPPSGFNYENDTAGGGVEGGDDEMWINFVGEDLFGGSW